MALITRCSVAGCTQVQAACRRATKSICVVTTSRYTNSLRWPHRKNPKGEDLANVAAIEPDPHVRSSGRGIPYPANHVQERRNAPEPHHAGTKVPVLPLMVCHRGTRLRPH
ncbi:hypothetical protein AVEN_130951-1 [Araneus ventricosus]|uniref:Uncharacterized protein n=1 Tax=Araneus ventricosus TaxID=182803 RepID=A0A4Y2NPB1_ARAVE|nr:hypothetical protein AVEN_130951-1 [Araneus ventricosus]